MRRRSRALTALALTASAVGVAAPAVAAWNVPATAGSQTSATARSLGTVTGVTATGGPGTARVTWNAETLSGIVTGYRVLRHAAATGGTATPVCSAALTATATACDDGSAPTGTVWYSVAAVHTAPGRTAPTWTGPDSTRASTTVTAPSPLVIVSAPTLAAASDSGSSTTDRITNVLTPVFTGTATPGATVVLRADGVNVGTVVADVAGTWSITATTQANGTRSFTTIATAAGMTSAPSAGTSVTFDAVAPVVTIAGQPNLSGASGQGTLAGTNGTATGAAPDVATVRVTYVGPGTATTTAGPFNATITGGTWSHAFTLTGKTTYRATVTQLDVAGNTGTASLTITT